MPEGAVPMIQRVAAADGVSSGAVRRMRPSVPPAVDVARAHFADRHADSAAA
jgi:hypothetical protein